MGSPPFDGLCGEIESLSPSSRLFQGRSTLAFVEARSPLRYFVKLFVICVFYLFLYEMRDGVDCLSFRFFLVELGNGP